MKRKKLAALGLAIVMAVGTVGTSGITVMQLYITYLVRL